ncbi:hypothetical protein [Devosia ginsengisoli]|uniref:hypothetical protein n=1 Tax=Devosia ginsengisoli TaxID=400770 RepID=UPI0026EABEF1|nr:hypothetical protein [Devosia ginsengisoli]MCR6672483.1 hypothetical protein [Devosia ginsengisoli]
MRFGTSVAAATLLIVAGWLVPAELGRVLAQSEETAPAVEPEPANIDRNGVLILVRTALLALDQANKTGNYTVLRDLGSPGFQANSAAQLGEIFASQRANGLDLAGVAVLEPQLTVLPQIRGDGMLRMAGFFPSVPTQVNFDLLFTPTNRQWRLFGISINLTQGGPVAPEAPLAPAEAAPEEPPVAPVPQIRVRPAEEVEPQAR